jgi:Uma2 family endonuclease
MTTVEVLPPERPIHGQMVLLPTPPPGGFTVADLPRLIEAVDARFELLDGEVLMLGPATHWHDEVIDILKHALRRIAPRSLVVATEKGIDLGRTVPEPDVLIVSRAVVTSGSLVFEPSDVHLAIEVVSPGTTKDRTLRPAQYASAGIKCFWRVENEDDAMVVYTFELLPEGGYAPTGVFRGRVKVDRPFPIDIELPEVTWLSAVVAGSCPVAHLRPVGSAPAARLDARPRGGGPAGQPPVLPASRHPDPAAEPGDGPVPAAGPAAGAGRCRGASRLPRGAGRCRRILDSR